MTFRSKAGLCVLLSISLPILTACGGGSAGQETEAPTEAVSEAVTAAIAEVTSDVADASADYDYAASSAYFPADTLILTAGGLPVYWDEFYYWMMTALGNVLDYSGVSVIEDWDAVFSISTFMYGEALTYAEFLIRYAADAVIMYRTIENGFEAAGLTLEEEDKFSQEEFMAYYGIATEAEYEAYLAEQNLTPELLDYIETVSSKYYALLESMYGESGETLSDEEALAYANAQGYIQAKHILISTVDENGDAYPDEELAVRRATAEELIQKLAEYTGTDPEGYFDELIAEYSEDPGQGEAGYLFGSGVMMASFEAAAGGLSPGEYSGIVETSYGYHIILRTETDLDRTPLNESSTLRYVAAYTRFDSIIGDWQAELETEYEPAYEQLAPAEIFTVD